MTAKTSDVRSGHTGNFYRKPRPDLKLILQELSFGVFTSSVAVTVPILWNVRSNLFQDWFLKTSPLLRYERFEGFLLISDITKSCKVSVFSYDQTN